MKSNIQHTLKYFKFLVYLIPILMLWGGFFASAQAEWAWKAQHNISAPFYNSCQEAAQGPTGYPVVTLTTIELEASYDKSSYYATWATVEYDTVTYYNRKQSGCIYFHPPGNKCEEPNVMNLDSVCSPPQPPDCPEGEEYNPDTQQCEALPPPTPPEKNFGGCSEGPSPYVASETK